MPSTHGRGVRLTTTQRVATDVHPEGDDWVAVVFTPLVLLYQGWTYWVFRQRISTRHIPGPAPSGPVTAGRTARAVRR